MGRRFTTLIGAGAVTLALTATSLALAGTATAPVKILGGRGSQELPAGAPGNAYLSWTQFRAGHVNAYLRPLGQPKILLNRRGYGWNGNISDTEASYQQVVRNNSNIWIYDINAQTRHAVPGVNTTAWEWAPHLDANNLLYGRIGNNNSWKILLTDTSGSPTTTLDKHSGKPVRQLFVGGIAGNWATWARYTPRTQHGTVVRYDIGAGTTQALPVPRGKVQYASTVDAAGDIFYVRSSNTTCGRGVNIREAPIGGGDLRLAPIPRGYDIQAMDAVDEGPGDGVTIYFDRRNCNSGFYDSYSIHVG